MLLDRENVLTRKIIGCCFEVHKRLGPGFDEKIYHKAPIEAFKKNTIEFETEKTFPVLWDYQKIGYKRLDLVVQNKVILEIKSVKGLLPDVFRQQLVSYLRVTHLTVGLLVNFGTPHCTVRRYLNDIPVRDIR